MTTPAQTNQTRTVLHIVLIIIGTICFVIAALAAGGTLTGTSFWAWGFGGFAAWCLAGAV